MEEFTSLEILEQLQSILICTGIKNIVKLKHDDIVIYHDREGNRKDIEFAMAKYEIEIDDSMSEHFKSLEVIVEHEDDQYKYLVDIKVWKSHNEQAYPVEITVNAFLKEFKQKPGVSKNQLK